MRKSIGLIIIMLAAFNVRAQLEIVQDSFKELKNFVIDGHKETDFNNIPYAVIKVRATNIEDEQLRELSFTGGYDIDIDLKYEPGEVWVYLTCRADYLKISHPDLDSIFFVLPFTLKPRGGYELTLINKSVVKPVSSTAKQLYNYLIVKANKPNAAIYIDGKYIGKGEVAKLFKVGETHSWTIECNLYHTESGTATIVKEDAVTIERKLEQAYGYINVVTQPISGATVFVDGKKIGNTPCKTNRLPLGNHTVRVMKELYSTVEQTVTVTDGDVVQASIALSADYVNVTITTDSKSDIYVDSTFKSKGRWKGRLSTGNHTFEARKVSHHSAIKNVTLNVGKDETIVIPNPEPIYGILDVKSSPLGAKVIIDGRDCGTTPKVIYDVLIGHHSIKFEMTGYASIMKNVNVGEGNILTINEKMSAGREVTISTDAPGDKIYVDGKYFGVSPVTTSLTINNHDIKVVRSVKGLKNPKVLKETISVVEGKGTFIVNLAFKQENNNHVYVDLGLPSGTLWATCNVGANSSDDFGNYYAWGEITTKDMYNWGTYKQCLSSYDSQIKYNTKSIYGTVDGKLILELVDDAANANWGGKWRMPTFNEMNELLSECIWTWTTKNGKYGYLVTGTNGKNIFLPAAGYRYDGSAGGTNVYGYYWTSSLSSTYPDCAYYLDFHSTPVFIYTYYRNYGYSIRPVMSPQN